MNPIRRIINALAPEGPAEYSDWDLASRGLDRATAGAWWCSYGTRHDIDEDCTCAPTSATVLAAAFPWHPLMADWAAEDDIYARYRRNGAVIVPAILDGAA
jgi:hypothetical protein